MPGAAFLLQNLREPRFTYPTPPDPYGIYQQALNNGLSLRRADEASQTNALNQQLLQERVNLLPYDRRYNQALQDATTDKLQAEAEDRRARADARFASPELLVQPLTRFAACWRWRHIQRHDPGRRGRSRSNPRRPGSRVPKLNPPTEPPTRIVERSG